MECADERVRKCRSWKFDRHRRANRPAVSIDRAACGTRSRRPGPAAARRGTRAHAGGPESGQTRLGRADRPQPALPETGLRLARRRRVAHASQRGHRRPTARHRCLRLPDPGGPGRLPARRAARAARRGPRARAEPVGRRRARRDRRNRLPLSGRCLLPRGAVGAGRRGTARHHRLPHRPRLGPGQPVQRRPRGPGHDLHPPRRIPAGRGRVRRRLLRHLAARGRGHGPAATPRARSLLGGAGACRHRPAQPARQQVRCVHRSRAAGVRHAAARGARRARRVPAHRQRAQRGGRPRRLHARPGGPDPDGRHRLLRFSRRHPPGRPRPAQRRGLRRHRGRRRHHGQSRYVHRLQPAAGPGRGRQVQGFRGRGRRYRFRRGCGRAGAGASVGRPPQRPPRPGNPPRIRHQPRRRVQRADRAQRSLPAAGDPPGAGGRRADGRRRGRRRSPRHRHHAGRPDRGPGAAGHLRPEPGGSAVAGLGQVQHRTHPGGRRRGGRDQDGDGVPSRHAAADAARRRAVAARGLVGGQRRAAHRAGGLAEERPPPSRGCVVVRSERDQRPRDRGRGAGRGDAGPGTRGDARPRLGRCPGAPGDLGAQREGPPGPGREGTRPPGTPRRHAAGRRGLLAGHHEGGPGAPGRGGRR